MQVHAEVDCFWLILPPFSGWLQKISVKQIFFPWLVQAREIKVVPEPPSAVFFCMPELLPKVGVLLACFFDRYKNFKFINWYLDVTI